MDLIKLHNFEVGEKGKMRGKQSAVKISEDCLK